MQIRVLNVLRPKSRNSNHRAPFCRRKFYEPHARLEDLKLRLRMPPRDERFVLLVQSPYRGEIPRVGGVYGLLRHLESRGASACRRAAEVRDVHRNADLGPRRLGTGADGHMSA